MSNSLLKTAQAGDILPMKIFKEGSPLPGLEKGKVTTLSAFTGISEHANLVLVNRQDWRGSIDLLPIMSSASVPDIGEIISASETGITLVLCELEHEEGRNSPNLLMGHFKKATTIQEALALQIWPNKRKNKKRKYVSRRDRR